MLNPGNFWFWFGGLWLGVGSLFVAVGGFVLWQEATLTERLASNGATASGIVLSKRMRGGSNQEPTFEVEYRFAVDGGVTERTAKVDGATWDRLVEGEPVVVSYVRDAPRLHRIAGQSREELFLGAIFGAVGGVFAVAGALILWRAAARRALVQRLARDGWRVDGEVLEVSPTNYRINRMPQWAIRYRYRDHVGNAHEGKTPPMAQEEARLWQPGDRGEVRFARERPHRSVWIGKG